MIGVNAPASNTNPAMAGTTIEARDLRNPCRWLLAPEPELLLGVSLVIVN
jgi:hypothetical protein